MCAAVLLRASLLTWAASAITLQRSQRGIGTLGEQATLNRMQWWQPGGAALPPSDKYVLFTGDAGGPNNIRIGWEMTGVVARATNRTFVLPPPWAMYLLDWGPRTNLPSDVPPRGTKTAVEDLIDLKQLKAVLPTLTWEEFAQRTGLSWEAAKAEAESVHTDQMCQLQAYSQTQSRILFMSGTEPRREGFSCGEWFRLGGPTSDLRSQLADADWALLTHGFVWHPDMFLVASKAVHALGIFEYDALHARYNDFQFHDAQQGAGEIMKRMAPFFKSSAQQLYIASDEPDKFQSVDAGDGFSLVSFRDMLANGTGALAGVKSEYTPERWFKMLGPVEELICTFSKVFVGTKQSSFTGHIDRMRLHAKAPVTRLLRHTEELSIPDAAADIEAWRKSEFVKRKGTEGDVFLLQMS